MIQDCSILLNDPTRLDALALTGLYGTKPEEAFARLNRLATKILKAPISIFSLIGEKSQFFKSADGFEITTENNEVPIDISVCQYSLQGSPLSIESTKDHPMFSENPAVKALDIVGYLGNPVITKSGQAIGAVCVIDHKKRKWTKEEISILEEITASFLSEIELRQAMELAKKELMLREEFIAIASHELKNPLSALKMQAQMVHKKISMNRFSIEDNYKFLEDLQRQTRRLELMIDDMSDSTRLASGLLTLNTDKMNLNELIHTIIINLSESLEKAQCRISYTFDSDISGNWDSSRVEQVITNLASNAMKYAPGSLIEINQIHSDDNIILTITDNGPGITPENQEIIFNKFGRASETNHIHGLGLGLYISRQIIEQHNGTLSIESIFGKGSAFIITLPIK